MSTTIPQLLPPVARGELTWSDFFCGGGGSSLGLHHVPGFKVKYALNHWDLAVQAHNANFPDTDHEVTVIEAVHPSRFGRTDCAWFSPSCTSQAYCGPRGVDEDSVRSRATMWDVPRWTEHHLYDAVVVENVIEAKLWCDDHTLPPKKRGGKRRGCSCGTSYEAWFSRMESLGYVGREVYFNSQHALVPQSRDRMYVVFVREGLPTPDLDFRPPAYCSSCETVVAGLQAWKRPAKTSPRGINPKLLQWGRYGKQYVYACECCGEPAAPAVLGSWSIVDHSIPIATIGSRPKAIAEATRTRIRTGLERLSTTEPIQLQVGGNLFERPGYARVWSLADPLRTVTTTPYMAMVQPQMQRSLGAGLDEPTGAVTTRSKLALVTPAGGRSAHAKGGELPTHTIPTTDRLGVVLRAGGQAPAPRSTDEPSMTLTAHDRQVGIVVPNKTNNVGRSTAEPAGTVTTSPAAHMLVYNGNPGFLRVLDDAAGTVTARDKQSLLTPPDVAEPLRVTEQEIDECLFRMLKWTELQKAQGMHELPDGSPYLLTARVPARGGGFKDLSDQDRVKMIGNAVSSPVAAMIGHALAEAFAA